VFDDETYFQAITSPSSIDLIKSYDSLDPNLRYVEGQSQFNLNDVLQQKTTLDTQSPSILPKTQIMTTSDIPSNELLQKS
ncbi:unnamed protein product, partial [Adineta steineri]